MVGVEAGGEGIEAGKHAARFQGGSLGVLQGTRSYLLQDEYGQVQLTHSVSAGLDYAAVGPEHAWLRDQDRVEYTYATDDAGPGGVHEAGAAGRNHPGAGKRPRHRRGHPARAPDARRTRSMIVNLSGRGDKDVAQVAPKCICACRTSTSPAWGGEPQY